MSPEHAVSTSLMRFRLRVSQPIGETYCPKHLVAIGDQCVLRHLSSEVAQTRISHDLAQIISCSEELFCQLIQWSSFRPGYIDIAVPWSVESYLRYRACNVIRSDRLSSLRRI